MNDFATRDKAAREAAILRAQEKANKTGVVQYVGLRYDCKVYVSKVKPTPDWLIATCAPTTAGAR